MKYPPNDPETELRTGEREYETEEEMEARVKREEDAFEDYSQGSYDE